MITKRPISTISYNSKEFITKMLDELISARKISFYSGVYHIGEVLDDGSKEKCHAHIYIEPHKKIDSMELIEMSKEVDPTHPDKPLKTIFWHYSDWDNWLLYALHDIDYLKLKMQKRQYQYTYDEFFYSDSDEFFERYNQAIHSSTIADMLRLPRLLKEHSVAELTALGYVRPDNATQYKAYEDLLRRGNMELTHKRKHE